jgi:hypothetical protein
MSDDNRDMTLWIQVLDDSTHSELLQTRITAPAEIVYAPTEIQGGPITPEGLRRALKYDLFFRRATAENDSEGVDVNESP